MLEIIAIIFLVRANKKNALARGRKSGGFIALTLVLWFGFEIIGVVVGVLAGLDVMVAALLGLAAAGVGGLISYLLAKSCKPGDYYPVPPMAAYGPMGAPFAPVLPLPPVQPLETPATIDIIRDYSLKGDITSWKFILNGETVGNLGNGATRRTDTQQQHNILRAVSDDGLEYTPLQFDIESGGRAEIHFKGDRFVHESCTGIQPMSVPLAPPPMPYAPPMYTQPQMPPPYGPPMYAPQMPPPYGPPSFMPQTSAASAQPEPGEGTVCSQCGAPVQLKDQFCRKCGAKQPGTEQIQGDNE